MEYLKRMLGMVASKPFKIQTGQGVGRVGITACTLKELRMKGMQKLHLKSMTKIVLEEDGTELNDEDYFQTLKSQTVLVFLTKGEVWEGCVTYLKLACGKLSRNARDSEQTIAKIRKQFADPTSPEMLLMIDYVSEVQSNIDSERRDEDPEWFEGLPQTVLTKRRAMRDLLRQRMKSYLWKCRNHATNKGKEILLRHTLITGEFQKKLVDDSYLCDYFDRSACPGTRLCSESGWFSCQGAYNKARCPNAHSINPYGSKDSRVLFSTWNLDHRIEISREIFPQLVRAIESCPAGKQVNWRYFYKLLFTVENIKLVEIRCHVKKAHAHCCVDKRKIYL